jgi:hypothetical protein
LVVDEEWSYSQMAFEVSACRFADLGHLQTWLTRSFKACDRV